VNAERLASLAEGGEIESDREALEATGPAGVDRHGVSFEE
jgi:hypothetical protein